MTTEYTCPATGITYKVGDRVKLWDITKNEPEFYHKDYTFEIVGIRNSANRCFFTIKDIDRDEFISSLFNCHLMHI